MTFNNGFKQDTIELSESQTDDANEYAKSNRVRFMDQSFDTTDSQCDLAMGNDDEAESSSTTYMNIILIILVSVMILVATVIFFVYTFGLKKQPSVSYILNMDLM